MFLLTSFLASHTYQFPVLAKARVFSGWLLVRAKAGYGRLQFVFRAGAFCYVGAQVGEGHGDCLFEFSRDLSLYDRRYLQSKEMNNSIGISFGMQRLDLGVHITFRLFHISRRNRETRKQGIPLGIIRAIISTRISLANIDTNIVTLKVGLVHESVAKFVGESGD